MQNNQKSINNNFIKQLSQLVRNILTFNNSADKLISEFFKSNHKLNQFERKLVGDTIYSIIRNYYKITAVIDKNTPLDIIGICWVQLLKLEPAIYADTNVIDFTKFNSMTFSHDIHSQTELPQWLLDKLVQHFSQAETLLLADAMQQRASLDLRVNLIKNKLKHIEQILHEEKIAYTLCPFSPLGIRLQLGTITPKHHLLTSGILEIQDESSQLACLMLAPKQNSMVVDFCAGSGGKALTLGMLMKNTGRIYALDRNETRLNKLAPRLARSGLSNIYPQLIAHENDQKLERLHNKIDYVFVDAPCSGLGTLRRNPELKLRQTAESITALAQTQISILTEASKLVKVGGNLVYATCSILYEENQAIVLKFLSSHSNFKLIPAHTILTDKLTPTSPTKTPPAGDYLVLLPHLHGTDGFFAACLQRIA